MLHGWYVSLFLGTCELSEISLCQLGECCGAVGMDMMCIY